MNETLSPDDVLRMRMRALGLAGHDGAEGGRSSTDDTAHDGAERIAAVARRMLALQGQDWRSARWALGVRAPGTTSADVEAAFDSRRIVRSWPMRGTVHIVAAEDIRWMQLATNHRVLAGAPKRRAFLGIDDAVLDRLVDTSLLALAAAGPAGLDRDRLAATWTEAGIDWQPNWRYHLIWWICQNGLAAFGPIGPGGEPLLVATEHWITASRDLAGDAALHELAVRYAAARGPFREKDLAWWTGLTVAEARIGIAAAAESGALAPVRARDAAGETVLGAAGKLWVDPGLLGATRDAPLPEWRLLAAFDEHLLGYSERSPQLDPEHFARIVPGRNGMFLPTVVERGVVVGTWKRRRTRAGGLDVAPFPGARIDLGALAAANRDWAAFHGVAAGDVALAE
ncbi:winged helix DNA-binding domain-containing protein [Leucobacter chromiiresistens]|uniref:Winged helix DNA-binding domain-containing protein n=1 Tax=Leucobacter chromiiresistens TaxID=1079994 RepID=A0A1H0ZJ08_9MICO|nr:winged helix DNA-binding domain-containing protein [Leucobacter chromiiresistens]SDQ27433.1 Winged helix DNA-binding domain-containing protein [Leucobacter chromiiresistens]